MQKKSFRFFSLITPTYLIFFFLLFVRLLANYLIPINDTTEARYAEIARKMLETHNWVTPMIDYGKPFLAKPPLSFWLTTLSMKIFGVNAFAARLPVLLLSIGSILLIGRLARTFHSNQLSSIATLVLTSCIFFFINAGAVMTDASLLFTLTLTMVSFWLAVVENENIWGYLFFVGLGLGLLAKGLLALVFPLISISAWLLQSKQWKTVWQRLPWFSGIFLTCLIAIPWYWMAELKNPGFLHYFIIGEHIQRFLDPSWQGDKYGYVHAVPKGTIWIYFLAGIFPWIIPLIDKSVHHRNQWRVIYHKYTSWCYYLSSWMLVPLIFFTLASNIIYPYSFPAVPPFSLLFATFIVQINANNHSQFQRWALITGAIFCAVIGLFVFKPNLVAKSQQSLIATWQQQNLAPNSHLIYWFATPVDSAQFYSHGKTLSTLNNQQLLAWINKEQMPYLVTKSDSSIQPLPHEVLDRLQPVYSLQIGHNTFTLYKLESPKALQTKTRPS